MTRAGRVVARIALASVVVLATAVAASGGDTFVFALLTVSISCGVGAFLIDRRPRNSVGWLVLAIGLTNVATSTPPWVDVPGLVAGRAAWLDFLLIWISAGAGSATFISYAAVAFVFPTGHLVQRRRRAIRLAFLFTALVAVVPSLLLPSIPITAPDGAELLVPNLLSPFGANASTTPPPAGLLVGTLAPVLLMAAGVVDLLRRYRRAVGIERLQMRCGIL